ncbi:MAG: flagellar biosynthesis anti-sigma factor FlgM [Aquabacterium sp.]|nr:MAG: flagellar biosynthesis anti-sigma factor FlgM [Aquabacterium sp.]
MKVGSASDKGVGSVGSTQSVSEGRGAVEGKSSEKTQGAGRVEDQSTVKLSKAASQLLSSSSTSGDFDAEKVDRVRKSIEDGSYKIDAGAIADKLIANASEVLNRNSN